MQIYRIYANNNLRNYNYIIACENTREAVVIDPLDVDQCLNIIKKNNLNLTKILNTHEHWDHIAGNEDIVKNTGANIYAHVNCIGKIPDIKHTLKEGDLINVGSSITITCLDTPGHTFGHICFIFDSDDTKAIFSGDTLFNAGAGNCYNGDVKDLYDSFTKKISKLPDSTFVYPGHDYLENNLNFTLNIEPENIKAEALLEKIILQNPENRTVTTIGLEKEINTFLRLKNNIPNIGTNEEEVFFKLRELRNNW